MKLPLHTINSVTAYALIVLSVIRYYTDIDPESVFMMPAFAAVILLIANNGIQYDQRPMLIIAFILHVALSYYFVQAIDPAHLLNEWEMLLMLILTLLSSIGFILRFIGRA